MCKKFITLLYIGIVLLLVVSCSAEQDIEVYDYKSIEVTREYIEVTDEDVKTIILLDYSSSEYYQPILDRNIINPGDTVLIDILCDNKEYQLEDYYYIVGDSDNLEELDKLLIGKTVGESFFHVIYNGDVKTDTKVLVKGICELPDVNDEEALKDFYSLENKETVYKFIKKRAQEDIIYDYAWNKTLVNSSVNKFPDNILEKMNEFELSLGPQMASSLSDEEKQSIYNYYFEEAIAETILKNENIKISQTDLDIKKTELSEKNKVSIDEISDYFSDEDIYNAVLMEKVKTILITYTKVSESE